MEEVRISKADEVHLFIEADRGILREISEEFTFTVPNYKFHPAYKARKWDGKIRVFDLKTQRIYVGLLNAVVEFCKDREYDIKMDYSEFAADQLSVKEAEEFIASVVEDVRIPNFEVRPYQVETFIHCVRNKRALFLSPTSSGKSFMIYLLVRWYDLPSLVIVDGTGPVSQMAGDFISYGHDEDDIHKIMSGQEKDTKRSIVVSTWQSLQNMPAEWFDRFGLIIGDEAHHFQAKSFTELMHKTTMTEYKFGFTGTITDSKTSKMVLEGLFGPVKQIVTTVELQEAGYITPLKIKCLVLQYSDEEKKSLKKATYQQEMDFIVRHKARNNFIKNLALSQKENTILFFQFVEKHGLELFEMIRDEIESSDDPAIKDRPVFFVHGGVDGEIRNDMRAEIEKARGAIIVASVGVFSTAISINNIHNLIFASPSKSKIRNLQSIGRGLRLHDSKDFVTLFDIADNLIVGSRKNYTILHFAERIKIYDGEKFKYKIYNIKLES